MNGSLGEKTLMPGATSCERVTYRELEEDRRFEIVVLDRYLKEARERKANCFDLLYKIRNF